MLVPTLLPSGIVLMDNLPAQKAAASYTWLSLNQASTRSRMPSPGSRSLGPAHASRQLRRSLTNCFSENKEEQTLCVSPQGRRPGGRLAHGSLRSPGSGAVGKRETPALRLRVAIDMSGGVWTPPPARTFIAAPPMSDDKIVNSAHAGMREACDLFGPPARSPSIEDTLMVEIAAKSAG